MTRAQFEDLVRDALASIPRRFREQLQNVAILVEDEPSARLLREMDIEPPDTLFGLYHGIPLPSRQWDYGNVLPDTISLFQGPIERACENDGEIVATIGETMIHEVAHYFGMDDDEIEEIEARYWRSRNRRAR
jgi:predicted Zn-dependent protease with MMP-like domain